MEDLSAPEVPKEYQAILDDASKETIHFFMPFEKSFVDLAGSNMEKGSKDSDPYSWKIGGLASSNDKDLDGEYIEPTAFDTDYLVRFGFFNNDHQKGPEHKVGIPTKAVVTDRGLWVEGYLLKDIPAAQGIYRLMKTLSQGGHSRKVGFSVEGKVLEQDGNRITKVFLKDIAITANPVNTRTYAELVKSMQDKKNTSVVTEPDLKKESEVSPTTNKCDCSCHDSGRGYKVQCDDCLKKNAYCVEDSKKEIDKALEAGNTTGNTGPSGPQTGGEALRVQSLDKQLKVTTNEEDNSELVKYVMQKSLINDEKVALKVIEYARLLKLQNEVKEV